MRRTFRLAAAAALALPIPLIAAAKAQAPQVAAAAETEDARLYAFLDAEFAEELRGRPQLSTQLGMKEGQDRLDDIGEAALLRRLEWRRASVERMKSRFDRSKLSPMAKTNYDIWALELERAELGYRFRRYSPAFYSFLYSVHSRLPDFLINTHNVQDAADMRAYAARLRALPAVLDEGIAQTRASEAIGVRAPKFQVERVIGGSRALIKGAPFDAGPASPLWADAQAKVAKLRSDGKVTPAEAQALLDEAPGGAAGDQAGLSAGDRLGGGRPAGGAERTGGGRFPPGRSRMVSAALKLNTTTDLGGERDPPDRAERGREDRGASRMHSPGPGRLRGPDGFLW